MMWNAVREGVRVQGVEACPTAKNAKEAWSSDSSDVNNDDQQQEAETSSEVQERDKKR